MSSARSRSVLDRLFDRWMPEPNTGCYIWVGYVNGGRPTLIEGGKSYRVARLVCEESQGPPPTDKHQAAHKKPCREILCISPYHIRWATQSENELDKPRKLPAYVGYRKDRGTFRVRLRQHGISWESFTTVEAAIEWRNTKLIELGLPIPD